MIATAPSRRPVELLGSIGATDDPRDTSSLLVTRLEQLKTAVESLEERARRMELENNLNLTVWREASAILPDLFVGVLPPIFQVYDGVMRRLDAKVREMQATATWIRRIPIWESTGVARIELSETVPGDLDLYVVADVVPEAPRTLQPVNIDGTDEIVMRGIITLIVALAYGAEALTDQLADARHKLDQELFSDLLKRRKAGELTETERYLLDQLTSSWRRAAETKRRKETSLVEEIPSLVKWGIVGGIVFGLINVTLRILELKKG